MSNGYGPEPLVYTPANLEKYKGTTPIILRSKLERELAMWLDRNPHCISWGSESTVVHYVDPSSNNNTRRYFIDFTAIFKQKDGRIKRFYIEVKPSRQTVAPKSSKRKKDETFANEVSTYNTNVAKWKAATKFAKTKGAEFVIITEKDLHIDLK